MEPEKPLKRESLTKPRIVIDADVLFAGAASPNENSTSNLLLRMAAPTLIEAVTSTQAITEGERNMADKMPKVLPTIQLLVSRCLRVVADPAELADHTDFADSETLPILVAALREKCSLLATFNVRHYQPGQHSATVLKPDDLVGRVRFLLARLSGKG